MNKKGFTLVELLAVLVVMGIIITIGVPIFTKYVNKTSDNYYVSLEKSLLNSAKDYLSENSNYYPKAVGDVNVVFGTNIINSAIMDKITDEKGNDCSSASKVYVKKLDKAKYEYTVCLICGDYKSNSNMCK